MDLIFIYQQKKNNRRWNKTYFL